MIFSRLAGSPSRPVSSPAQMQEGGYWWSSYSFLRLRKNHSISGLRSALARLYSLAVDVSGLKSLSSHWRLKS